MKKIFIYPLVCIPLFTSCKRELLNPKPETQVSTVDLAQFETADRILNQVRGLYGTLKNGSFYGGRYVVYGDIRGEDFINETGNGVTGLQTWNFTVNNSSGEVTSLWSQAYAVINNCNVFLDGMASKGNAVVGNTLAKNYNAEAKFLRALSYYSLLQFYARPYYDNNGGKPGLPLRLKGNTVAGNYDLARSTVADIYQQILSDLNSAETDLPSSYSSAYLNTTRAHRNTVIALKTRVYLAMQKYAEVVTEANKIVSASAPFSAPSGVSHTLQADITNVFKPPYTTTESIFSMPMTTTSGDYPGTQNSLASYYSPTKANGGTGTGEYSLNLTGIVADASWKATDKRRTFIITSSNGKKWLNKYNTASPYTDYVPVIRYAEVLLNLAEARVRSTSTVDAQAVALLNAVRNRSDASTTFTIASFSSANELIDAILRERRIELLGEGFRSSDLLRLGLPIPAKSTVIAVPASDARYIWPISANELLYNKLMTDNQ